MPNNDLISRNDVLEIIMQYCTDDDGSCAKPNADLREMLDEVENISAVDAEPVRHGRWINGTLGTECSCCGDLLPIVWCPDDEDGEHCIEIDETLFCPNCGAKMDKKE